MTFNSFLTNLNNGQEDKNKLSVLFWLNNAKKSKKTKLIPFYCRITLNGARATKWGFSANISIKNKKDWNSKLQRIMLDTEEAELQNDRMQRIKLDIMQVFAVFELAGKPFTSLDVHNEYLGKTPVPIVHTLQNLVDKWEEMFQKLVKIKEKSDKTLESYQEYNIKTVTYFGSNKPLMDFTESMWEDFRLHLRTLVITTGRNKGQTLHINTVAKVMGHFGTLFNYAKKLRWLPIDLYEDCGSSRIKAKTLALTTKQLEHLIKIGAETKNEGLKTAIDIFVFLASTGFSYKDYCCLTAENFTTHEDGRKYIVKEYREKSPIAKRYGKSIVPILKEAHTFLDKYGKNPDNFPKPDSHEVNDLLKIAWEIIGVTEEMALKNSRHTFINYARSVLGLPEEAIIAIVGHSTVRTTEESYLIRDIEMVENDLKRANL
jgi:integrase/recombinase XerD